MLVDVSDYIDLSELNNFTILFKVNQQNYYVPRTTKAVVVWW